MKLPKSIRFWLFKLKAHNSGWKIKEGFLISAFWVSIVAAIIIWVVFGKTDSKPAAAPSPEPLTSIVVKEASPSIQVFLYKDESLLKDLPKQAVTKNDLDSLLTASQNSDLNIDKDLDQINY